MKYLVFNKVLLDSREVDENGLQKIFGSEFYSIQGHLLKNNEYNNEYHTIRKINKKTYKEWIESKVCFSSFVQEGDVVDEAIVDYFVEVLPPVTMNFTMVQMGEPYDMVGGRNRYLTLEKVKNEWVYTGKKVRGGK